MSGRSRPVCHNRTPQQASEPKGQVGSGPDSEHSQLLGNAAMAARLPPAEPEAFPFQNELEALFGVSFGGLGVSLGDPRPAAVGATAFTDGNCIVFGETQPDKQTVAHELIHVLQSGGGSAEQVESTRHPAEREAAALAPQVAAGRAVSVTGSRGPGLHREAIGESETDKPTALSVDVGQKPLDPIRLTWDPAAFELGGDTASAGAHLTFGLHLIPVEDPSDSLNVMVNTTMFASASAFAKGSLSGERKTESGPAQANRMTGEASVSGSVETSLGAQFTSHCRHSRVSYERVRTGLLGVQQVVDEAIEAYREGVELARGVQRHITRMKSAASSLSAAYRGIQDVLNTGEDAGEWAGELVLLGQTLGALLIELHAAGDGAVAVVGTLMGQPDAAQALEGGESYELRMQANAKASGAVSLGGDIVSAGTLMLAGDVAVSRDASASWDRVFRVDGNDSGDSVDIHIHFERAGDQASKAAVGAGRSGVTMGVATSGKTQQSDGHSVNLRLQKSHPQFGALYERAFDAMTPSQLIALTHHKELIYDGGTGMGVLSIAMDKNWAREHANAGVLKARGAQATLGTQHEGNHESHVVIDYETAQLHRASTQASGETSVTGTFEPGEKGEKFGLESAKASLGFARNAWAYDGKTASFSGAGGTLIEALGRIRIAMGETAIRGLVARAHNVSDWEDACLFNRGGEMWGHWRALGKNLKATLADPSARQIDLSLSPLGAERTSARFSAAVLGAADGPATVIHDQPYIPLAALREWQTFLAADLLSGFIAEASSREGAEVTTNLFLIARGVHYESGANFGETAAGYAEVGVELEGHVVHADGTPMSDLDWFTKVEDRSIHLVSDLVTARDSAVLEQQTERSRQLDTGGVIEHTPDQQLVQRAGAQLSELEAVLAQIDGMNPVQFENPNAMASMARFATQRHAELADALSNYHDAYGWHVSRSGYAVSLDGTEYNGETQSGAQNNGDARDADTRAAERLALSMATVLGVAEHLLDGMEAIKDSASTKGRVQKHHSEVAEAMVRWHTMNRQFKSLYRKYSDSSPLIARSIGAGVWDDAVTHERRNAVVKRSMANDGVSDQLARWEMPQGPAGTKDDVATPQAPPEAPKVRPELFETNHPYPRPLVGMSANKVRPAHETLSPEDLRTIGPSRKDWGFTADAGAQIIYMAAAIVCALDDGSVRAGHVWTIEGHADLRDTDVHNFFLGHRRALAVRALLIHAGVPPAVLTVRSYGERAPIAQGPIQRDEEADGVLQANRRVESDQGQPATTALFAPGAHHSRYGSATETEAPDRAANREQQRSKRTRGEYDLERDVAWEQERFASLVLDLYNDPVRINLLTVVAGLTSEAEALNLFRLDHKLTTLRARCKDEGIAFQLPVNRLALADAKSKSIALQPGMMTRQGPHSAVVRAAVWKVGGLQMSLFEAGPYKKILQGAIEHRLQAIGGPTLLVDGQAMSPHGWTVESDLSVRLTIIAANDGGETMLDRLGSQHVATVQANPGLGAIPFGRASTHGEDAYIRDLRSTWLTWNITQSAVVLDSPMPIPARADPSVYAPVWEAHTNQALTQLEVPVVLGATSHLIAVGTETTGVRTGEDGEGLWSSIDVEPLFDQWMNLQGRDQSVENTNIPARVFYEQRKKAFVDAMTQTLSVAPDVSKTTPKLWNGEAL